MTVNVSPSRARGYGSLWRRWRGRESWGRLLRLELFMEGFIRFPLSFTPRPFLIDKPMLRHIGPADLRFCATVVDHLVITVAGFLISIFHPNAGLVHHVGQ